MTDDDAVDRLVEIDQAIDEIVAMRSAAGQQAGPVPQPRTADEALVADLAALGALDWPADDVGERIIRAVAAALAPAGAAVSTAEPEGEAEPGRVAGPGLPAGPRHQRRDRAGRGRRRWPVFVTPLAAAAAVLAVVAGVLAVTSGHGGPAAGTSPASPSAPAPFASPFRYLGTADEPGQMDCVTASVCNALVFVQTPYPPLAIPERTTDGGRTWHRLAIVPNVSFGALTFPTFVTPSCPTAAECFVATDQGLAMTTDGGASWHTEPTPAVPGGVNPYIDAVSCATADDCVIHVTTHIPSGGFAGTLFSTTDGGRNWTIAAPVPGDALSNVGYLHCDLDGDCIGLGPVLTANNVVEGFQAVTSADHGIAWTVRPPYLQTPGHKPALPNAQLPMIFSAETCGDALHCIVVGSGGIAVTSDGGVTWQQSAVPDSYRGSDFLVSCAAGLDCVLAAGPLIETTTNGLTWSPQPVPAAGGSPLVGFVDLSCPGTAGCVAVGVTRQQLDAAQNSVPQGSVISSLPG
jgi:photosystem II stability/assembly factor-like uncharacterized protein